MLKRKAGRPRGGKHHEEVREYWREAKGYKDRDKDFINLLRNQVDLDSRMKALKRRERR